MTDMKAQAGTGMQPARPQLIRAMNEQLLLNQIRQLGLCSRADLARLSGLSKPTVSLAPAHVERSGLVRTAGTLDVRQPEPHRPLPPAREPRPVPAPPQRAPAELS